MRGPAPPAARDPLRPGPGPGSSLMTQELRPRCGGLGCSLRSLRLELGGRLGNLGCLKVSGMFGKMGLSTLDFSFGSSPSNLYPGVKTKRPHSANKTGTSLVWLSDS